MSTQLLRFELMRRLRDAYPNAAEGLLESKAVILESTGAYMHNGTRVVPIGDRATMARAALLEPAVTNQLTAEHVKASSASSTAESAPVDRAAARLASMGIDLDRALNSSGTESWLDNYDFTPKGAA